MATDALWIGILIVVTIDLQRRLIWESDRPVAIAIQGRLIDGMSWVLARVRRRRWCSNQHRVWQRIDAVQRAGLRHEHVNGDGSVQGLVGRGNCPICGEFVDNERAA